MRTHKIGLHTVDFVKNSWCAFVSVRISAVCCCLKTLGLGFCLQMKSVILGRNALEGTLPHSWSNLTARMCSQAQSTVVHCLTYLCLHAVMGAWLLVKKVLAMASFNVERKLLDCIGFMFQHSA